MYICMYVRMHVHAYICMHMHYHGTQVNKIVWTVERKSNTNPLKNLTNIKGEGIMPLVRALQ